ncbi:MAG TPA: PASTA domain-containing protein, partial [Nocardioides sp.]|nr:PASTA domain-containing protein [Nocardioides sp.]
VGDSPVAVAYQHVREPAVPPSDHDTELPEAIDAIVMKALAKRVEDRYQSAAAMRSDIERYLAGRPVHAVVPPPPPTTTIPSTAATAVGAPLPEEDEDDTRSRKVLYVLLGLLLLALIAAGAYLLPSLFESPPEQVQVPDLIGKTEAQARAEIGNAGLAVGDVEFREDANVRADRVIEQDPNRDQFADPGTEVDIVVSSGKPLVDVPFVVGRPRPAAAAALRDANLEVTMQERESDEPAGRVLSTDPPGGDKVPEGTLVTVFYSDGPEQVPGVVGLRRPEAEQVIRDSGFVPDVVEDPNSNQPRGTVIRQSPAGGQDAPQGSTVTIVVSAFEEEQPSESPSPTETPPETTPPPDETIPPTTESPAVQGRSLTGRDQRNGLA